MISYEQFKQSDLRVARIIEAARIEGSDKLLKLKVELGCKEPGHQGACMPEHAEFRQIIAGIGKAYEPETIIGKQITIITNLEPRMLMGIESQGMVLAAHGSDGKPVLLVPEKEVPQGSTIS